MKIFPLMYAMYLRCNLLITARLLMTRETKQFLFPSGVAIANWEDMIYGIHCFFAMRMPGCLSKVP